MTPSNGGNEAPTLRDYGRVLRRRAGVIAVVVGLAVFAALLYDLTSKPLYEASSEILLSRDSPAARLTDTSDVDTKGDPERFIQTQRQIARTDRLASRVLAAADLPHRKPGALVAAMKVVVPQNSDVLKFEVRDPNASVARRLARTYAAEFATYQRRLDEAALDRALATVETRIATLEKELETEDGEVPASVAGAEARGERRLYKALLGKRLELQTLAPLESGKSLVLSASDQPDKVRPRPKRDLAIALAFGLLLGVILAFILEAVDRRVDSVRGIATALGLPLLGQVRLQRHVRQPLPLRILPISDPPPADGLEVLQGNFDVALEAVGLSVPGTALLATSATRGDGQSSVTAGLSVALARSGKRVVLVDLEPNSSLDRLLGLNKPPGAIDVATGAISLDEALITFNAEGGGVRLLPLGTTPDLLGWFLSAPEANELVAVLRAHADLVLLNAPPLLATAGVRRIAAGVDAVFMVVNADGARERTLRRLRSELALLAPDKLGFVATGRAVEPLETPDPGRVVPIAGSSFLSATDGSEVEAADESTHGKSRGRQRVKP